MNKYLKGFLVFLVALISLAALLIGGFCWSMHNKHRQAEIDGIKFSKICNSALYITVQPKIRFINFTADEINLLKFQILRNGEFIKDTIIKNTLPAKPSTDASPRINIPYEQFLKSDTIVLTTKNKLQYYISDYHYYAYLHYGMFGYLGTYDCRFAEDNCTINNKGSNGIISKNDGWINPEKSKHINKINP